MNTPKPFIPVILLVCLLTFPQTGFAQADQKLTRDIFKELIEINTTHSAGNTTKAAEAMAARLRAAGFSDKDLFIGGPTEKKGNLVALPHVRRQRKPLVLPAHIFVFEALLSALFDYPFQF